MSQENFLYNVIRKVEKTEAATRSKSSYSTEKVVIIDKRTGEIQSKVPAISFGGNLSYYVVSNDPSIFSDPRELEVEVSDFANDRKLGLLVTYRASYEADKSNNEEKIVKALYNNNSLEADLDKKIERWVIKFSRDRIADFIDNYFDEIKKLQNYLQLQAKNEVGLRLELRISPIQTQDAPNLGFNNRDASNIAEHSGLIIEVVDIASDRQLGISIAYRASYDPLDREKVAQQLFTTGKPIKDEIDKKLKSWVNDRLRGSEGEFIDLYLERVTTLRQDLVNIAKAETGIQLDLNISLNKQVETIIIPSSEITVRVSDSDEALDLTIQTELLVLDRIKAISHSNKWGTIQLTNLLKAEIKNYLQLHIKISDFYYELKDKVRNVLVDYLNQKLADKGRTIGYLYLESKVANSSPAPKELVEIQHIVKCTVQNYSKLIPVENTLQMLPQDVRRYISAQSPNLQAWVESKLEKIVKPLLLSKKYIEILSDFQTVSDAIRDEMGKAAESIGYKIQHIVSIPRLTHLDLKKDFEIESKNEEFSTNTSSIKVKLTTTVNAKFDSFNQIEQYLDRGVDEIIEEMQKVVNTKTREVLRQILPERFYMHFYYADKTEGRESVEKELQEAITTALEERFGVKVNTVVPIPEETYIIEYLQRLTGMIGKFECEINSTSGSELVKFKGEFKIEGIGEGSWYRFQTVFLSRQQSQQRSWQELDILNADHLKLISLGDVQDSRSEIDRINQRIIAIENDIFGLDGIQGCIQESLESNLFGIFDTLALQYTSPKDKYAIDKEINQWAVTSVTEQYGLQIKLLNIKRTQSTQEKYQQELTQKKLTANYEQSLQQIEESKKQNQQKLEARTTKIAKQLKMSSSIYDDKEAQLNELYKKRNQLKLIGFEDEDSKRELKYVEEEIKTLQAEVIDPSTEEDMDDVIDLNSLKPQQSKRSSFLEAKEEHQKSMLPENNQDSLSKSDRRIENHDED
jgi:hypothetical protein